MPEHHRSSICRAACTTALALGLSTGAASARVDPPATQPTEQVSVSLEAALGESRRVRAQEGPGAAADVLVRKARAILDRLAPLCASDVAGGEVDAPVAVDVTETLRRALDDAEAIEDPSIRLGRLGVGFMEAQAAAGFRPVMEAELPAGFPAPGPVGRVVVKDYPAYRAARTPMAGESRDGGRPVGQNTAFNRLFRHITTNDVKMTAPVEMAYDARGTAPVSMAFLYETPTQGSPGPSAGDVEVVDLPAMKVVSIGLRGVESRQRIDTAAATLAAWLDANHGKYEAAGPIRYMGYNSPFVLPYLRFSEVQLPIRERPAGDPGRL